MAQRKISVSSRLSRNSSRCASVERLDIVTEEEDGNEEAPFRHFINKQEVLAEDEMEEGGSDSDDRMTSPVGRKISHDRASSMAPTPGPGSRKMSGIESMMPSRKTSASSSNMPSR